MGVHLDWEIEAEQQQVRQASGEDPRLRRKRRLRWLRLILLPLIVLACFGLVLLSLVLRVREIEAQVDARLRASVEAEVAALRIGDETAFLDAQRSASPDWIEAQRRTFAGYQSLKLERDLQLTGRVLDTELDGPRARVQVEEIIDGAPYVRTWFYWRYDDGWRHVPPDYTFWGAPGTFERESVTVAYRGVDAALGAALGEALARWLEVGCAALGCQPPALRVEITPDGARAIEWAADDPWLLRVPSPYVELARADMPFDLNLQLQTATLLAERLVAGASGDVQPIYPADSFYLQTAAEAWLVERFAQVGTGVHLFNSLAANYGNASIGQIVRALEPDSGIGLVAGAVGASSLATVNADWRDFFAWRLAVEHHLLAARDQAGLLALYAADDPGVAQIALERFNGGAIIENPQVVSVVPEFAEDGALLLRVVVGAGEQTFAALYRTVDDTWARIN